MFNQMSVHAPTQIKERSIKMKKYTVIYTDMGDSCDYRARILGTYNTVDKAREEMMSDVGFYCENNDNLEITDETEDYVLVGDFGYGCQWQIIEG